MRILLTLLLFFSLNAHGQPEIPPHGGSWVHDQANVLSEQFKRQLEYVLQGERDSTSNQIAVLLIPSLEGGSLEDYSLRVAEEWKLGKAEKDNGVLLLIVIQDRLMRIETGYGLEGSLTDAMSSRIIRNEIAPHFRSGDYERGVEAGVMGIIHAIKGEYTNDDPPADKRHAKKFPLSTIIIIIIIIILASRRGRGGGGHWSSGRGWIGPIGGLGGGSRGWGGGGGGFGGSFGGGGGFGGGGSSGSW
ncbi:MAG TPA: TPM domain-containing protein [Chryseolinea sp.]